MMFHHYGNFQFGWYQRYQNLSNLSVRRWGIPRLTWWAYQAAQYMELDSSFHAFASRAGFIRREILCNQAVPLGLAVNIKENKLSYLRALVP
jgi:hypothetical protein